ncbi:MAG: hypothetical protein HC796_10700 [Synechococcaceae cyanobacterium RL_1_2]|nr:hypothetical protein [Synechococcaceae cyanobacterium RL_1_2]
MNKSNTDLRYQARAGSVTAIIQILNEQLASMAIRTRAVLNQNVLHVLCEGQQLDQGAQTQVVLRVKETLEAIAPTNFKKAHIYGRLAKEEQVLWFEAIQSNPDREVLWSERVKLKQPNLLKRWQNKDNTPVKLTRDVDLIGGFSNKEKSEGKVPI